jgi:hypothetical protein
MFDDVLVTDVSRNLLLIYAHAGNIPLFEEGYAFTIESITGIGLIGRIYNFSGINGLPD